MNLPPSVEAFIGFARRYSRAERHYDNMASTGSRDRIDDALAAKQEIEAEVAEHFMLVKTPAAMGGRR